MANSSYASKVYFVICLFVIFNVCECAAFAAGFPIETRVTSIRVKKPLAEKEVLSAPKIKIGESAHLIINGVKLSSELHAALTKEKSKNGVPCNSTSIMSTALELYKYSNYKSQSEIILFLTPTATKNLEGHAAVWLCLSVPTATTTRATYYHMGHTSKIIVDNHSVHGYVRKRSKRSVEAGATGLIVSEFKGSKKNRGAEYSGYRTRRDTLNSSKEKILDVSGDKSASITSNVSESKFNVDKLIGDKSVKDLASMASYTNLNMRVYGIRVKSHDKGIAYEDGIILLQAGFDAEIRLFGEGLTKDVFIQFTAREDAFGGRCDVATSDVFPIVEAQGNWAVVKLRLPVMSSFQERWYLCIRESNSSAAIHQGFEHWLTISTYSQFLPLWIQVIFLVVLLLLSGLFSGLNLGLMALDKTELKIVSNTGTPTERRHAKAIEPVRRHGNFLLCTLLLGNVLVNSSLTILLDNLSTGLIAVIVSTISIVLLGEIVPQAICSRHGLAVGAKTVWLVRIFMVLTGPVSWPVSKVLDLLLGEEIGSTYDRERLKELIRVTQDSNELRLEEQNIICGALELHRKTVAEVMTRIEDVYMLSIDSYLDFTAISKIMEQGYSRIPIYEGERTNIVSVLFTKDLVFIDPDSNTPLRTVSQFYQNICNFVFEDTTLDIMFKEFKEGNKGHMAFVQRVNNEGDCDPFYEVVGLVTLEDVIEELIQEEILDETDVFTDNKSRRRRKQIGKRDFKEFSQPNPLNHRKVLISPQLQLAAFQYMRTTIEPCKQGHLSEGVLKRMLTQDIIHIIKPSVKEKGMEFLDDYLYQQGKPADYFILILEGHVEVKIGKENLTFDSGPFTYFGMAALANATIGESPSLSAHLNNRNSIIGSAQSLDLSKFSFTPDYSVKATTEVTFLKIRRSHYLAARRAFLLERCQRDPLPEETFEKEMEKILRDEILSSSTFDCQNELENSKDSLLNCQALRSKSAQDKVELALLNSINNSRRTSLKDELEGLTMLENTNIMESAPSSEQLYNEVEERETQEPTNS